MKYLILIPGLFILISLSFTSGQTLDAIHVLASCGSDCWTQDPNNKAPENINLEKENFDGSVVRCMQVCFAAKTKKVDTEEQLPPQQILKIKVSSYCGHICFNNNKASKKSLDYCYAGCLGTILQPKHNGANGQNRSQTTTPPPQTAGPTTGQPTAQSVTIPTNGPIIIGNSNAPTTQASIQTISTSTMRTRLIL